MLRYKKMAATKFIYLYVIQFRCDGSAWEDVGEYPKCGYKYRDVLHDLKEYRLSGGGEYRIIERREKRNG